MFSFFCLSLSSAILFFVLKYRVHIHVTCASRVSDREPRPRAGKRHAATVHDIQEPTQDQAQARRSVSRESLNNSAVAASSDLISALRNLGANPATARAASAKAIQQSNHFDEQLKLAIQYATTKEAA